MKRLTTLLALLLLATPPALAEDCLCDSEHPLRFVATDDGAAALIDGGLAAPIPVRGLFDGASDRRLLHFVLRNCRVYVEARAGGDAACKIVDTNTHKIFAPPGGCLAADHPTRAFRLGQAAWIAVWEEEARRFHLGTYTPKSGNKVRFSYHYADGTPIDTWPVRGAIRMSTNCDLSSDGCRHKFERPWAWEFRSDSGLSRIFGR